MRSYVFIGFLTIFVAATLSNLIFFDWLIHIQSSRFHLDWVKDGKPLGMFHTLFDAPLFRGSISRNRLIWRWVYQKPGWVEKDEKAARIYKYYRAAGIAGQLLILFVSVSFIVIFLMQP